MSGHRCAFIISFIILLINLSFFKPVVYMAEDDEFVGEERVLPYMVASEGLVEFLCTGNARCIPLSSCPSLLQLVEKSCLNINKLRDLTCGYKSDEPLVCCPQCSREESAIGGSFPRPPSPPRPSTSKQCGHPQLYNWQGTTYKGIGSQPWVARVGFKNKVTKLLEHPCCGSIIAPRVVLTTAHCALKNPDNLSIVSVRVGEYDISQNPDCTPTFCALPVKDVPLSHVVIHPAYNSKTYRHNIALLVLKQRLNYSVTVQPICLHQSHSALEGSRAILVGWGRVPGDTASGYVSRQCALYPAARRISNIKRTFLSIKVCWKWDCALYPACREYLKYQENLSEYQDIRKRQQQIDLPVIGLDRCMRVYGGSVPLSMNEICVGGEEGKDACSGFGGAPLVLMDKTSKGHFTQIGIVSFGSEKCGVEGIPSVYVRVDQYLDWIKLNSPNEG